MDIENIIENTIDNYIKENTAHKERKSAAGRKNKGITKRNRVEYIEEYAKEQKDFRNTPQAADFDQNIIEHVTGEIIQDDDIKTFSECYRLTCYSALDRFKEDNPELVKKHPYAWYKPLLLDIKSQVPKITADDLDRLAAVWEVLKEFLFSIGLYPTFEIFQYMTGIYKEQLENRQKLNPKYTDVLKKIYNDSKNALISELAINPYNQTNKIFLAKSIYGLSEQTETKHIEVTHNIRKLDNLPMFSDGENT